MRALVVALIALLAGCASSSSTPTTTSTVPPVPSSSTTSSSVEPSTTSTTGGITTTTTAAVVVNGVAVEPHPELTPGAADPRVTQQNVQATICRSGYTATVRPPVSYTDGVKTERLRAYGYTQPRSSFELDHLIPLELGGDPRAVANLWPEPWEKTHLVPEGFGAETKDQFENYLHRAVCAGRIALVDAQQQMAIDWVGHARAAGLLAG